MRKTYFKWAYWDSTEHSPLVSPVAKCLFPPGLQLLTTPEKHCLPRLVLPSRRGRMIDQGKVSRRAQLRQMKFFCCLALVVCQSVAGRPTKYSYFSLLSKVDFKAWPLFFFNPLVRV